MIRIEGITTCPHCGRAHRDAIISMEGSKVFDYEGPAFCQFCLTGFEPEDFSPKPTQYLIRIFEVNHAS